MSVVIVTGSGGLVGSEAALRFGAAGHDVVGIDNDMRRTFFGDEASTTWNVRRLQDTLGSAYCHADVDIRDSDAIDRLFRRYGSAIALLVHTAAQPSHDWAARDPATDFGVNATGTLNVLEATRQHAPEAPFIFTSTNKVYGDRPNTLPLVELDTRWELDPEHPWHRGVPEEMSLDETTHSIFGASKVAADVLVQEYGRYFGMRTVCFRGGTLTGPSHSATELHGFLAYLVRCVLEHRPYTVYGYKAKQVRDAIHCEDLIAAFEAYAAEPRIAAVYNIGGGRFSHCSMLEAIDLVQEICGDRLDWTYSDQHRVGDHIWYVSDLARFESDYPAWSMKWDVPAIIRDIADSARDRWR